MIRENLESRLSESSGVVSMARPMGEARADRVTATAIDAVMSEGSPAKRIGRKSHHPRGTR